MHRAIHATCRAARRVAITTAGAIVILAGIAMLVLPGPGLLTIVLGLMILGVEFAFARRWVQRIQSKTREAARAARARVRRQGAPRPPGKPD
jgi:uncharacterized protein (TIGR02611 family)